MLGDRYQDRVLQAAVDELADLIGHPVLIEDAEHLPLWWSEQDGVDKTRIRTFLRRSIDPAARAMLRQRKVATATGPIRTPPVPAIECTPAGVNRCGLARR